ncbi:hypothetical protein FAM10859_01911 [Lacticaseibacillus paracasei]|nr:hypothetical protein FAM10859_01911 [Lacticaseibacillus paracasei]
MLRFLNGPAHALLKRALQPRNLHVRALVAMAQNRPSRPRPFTLRFLTGLVRALPFW